MIPSTRVSPVRMTASPTMIERPSRPTRPTIAASCAPAPRVAGPRPADRPDDAAAVERERRHEADAGEDQVERADDHEHVGRRSGPRRSRSRPPSDGERRRAPTPIARLVSGPASAIAASARGVAARTSTTAGEPMKWTEIDVDRHARAPRDERVGELVGDDREHEPERADEADRPAPASASIAPAGASDSRPPTVTVMIATMKIHERWSRISMPKIRATGTPFIGRGLRAARAGWPARPPSRRGGRAPRPATGDDATSSDDGR